MMASVRTTPKSPMRFNGNLKSWNDERGFGFIEPVLGGGDVFVHIKAFPGGTGRPSVGQSLTYELGVGPNGKIRAQSVRYKVVARAANPRRPYAPASWTIPRVLAIPVFVAVWFYVASRWLVSPLVFAAYIVLCFVAFFAYGLDKLAAIKGNWRTPEKTLHLLGLAGGWPGALFAQQLLRHKCSKPSFVAEFWFTVVANVTLFVALHSGLLSSAQR
jgi:uncharacterized membrane protein YsdA (DUF1294 family)/cold shock CspA family protein